MQPGYNGHGKIDFFPSTLREHPHSLTYEPNDARDCHTSAPYRRIRSAASLQATQPKNMIYSRITHLMVLVRVWVAMMMQSVKVFLP